MLDKKDNWNWKFDKSLYGKAMVYCLLQKYYVFCQIRNSSFSLCSKDNPKLDL